MIDHGREVETLVAIVALVDSVDGSLESAESACIDARFQAQSRLLELGFVTMNRDDPESVRCPGCGVGFEEDFEITDGCQCPNCRRTIRFTL